MNVELLIGLGLFLIALAAIVKLYVRWWCENAHRLGDGD